MIYQAEFLKKSKFLTNSYGNILGLTDIEYLALPVRAKIRVNYLGRTPGEGFIRLRKL